MLPILVVSFVQTARNLLPMLKGVCLVKILHPIQQTTHHLAGQPLVVNLLFKGHEHLLLPH